MTCPNTANIKNFSIVASVVVLNIAVKSVPQMIANAKLVHVQIV